MIFRMSYLSSDCVLYEAVEGLNLWFEANNLVINKDRIENVIFSLSEGEARSVMLLGIHLDNKLNWENHTKSLCTRLSRIIFLLKKLCTSAYVITMYLVIKACFAFFSHTFTVWGYNMVKFPWCKSRV
jgi:hypothetical protein